MFTMIPQDATDDKQKAKRAAMAGIQVTGTIPLNSALLERYKAGALRSRKPESVEEYMTNNLQYRVARVSIVPTFTLSLSKTPLTIHL